MMVHWDDIVIHRRQLKFWRVQICSTWKVSNFLLTMMSPWFPSRIGTMFILFFCEFLSFPPRALWWSGATLLLLVLSSTPGKGPTRRISVHDVTWCQLVSMLNGWDNLFCRDNLQFHCFYHACRRLAHARLGIRRTFPNLWTSAMAQGIEDGEVSTQCNGCVVHASSSRGSYLMLNENIRTRNLERDDWLDCKSPLSRWCEYDCAESGAQVAKEWTDFPPSVLFECTVRLCHAHSACGWKNWYFLWHNYVHSTEVDTFQRQLLSLFVSGQCTASPCFLTRVVTHHRTTRTTCRDLQPLSRE